MGDFVCLVVGLVGGWFAHRYREKFTRFSKKVQKAAEEELN